MNVMLLLCSIFFCCWQANAATTTEKGYAIIVEADRRVSGFGDYTMDMEMILRDRAKHESQRSIRSRVLEIPSDGDKSLTIFDSPKDVRGTALLTFSHKFNDDDQWLYLPALKRVKRISSSNKSGPFMGSEFAYEDLGSREVEKYSYRYLTDEEVDNRSCFVVEMIPKDAENSGYSRIVSWLDQEKYRVIKEDYYDKKNRLLKTLKLQDYRLYIGFLWKAHQLKMVNHQNGKETDLLLSNFKFNNGLTDQDFNKNSLKRLR